MHTLYIVIVLLAFLGILINGSPEQSSENKTLDRTVGRPSPHPFNIPPHTDTPLKDDINVEEIVANKFDVMGNKLISLPDNGLKAGKLLINTDGKNSGVPTTRLSHFASASALVAKEPLMTMMPVEEAVNVSRRMGGLPKDAFPQYDLGALIPLTSRDVEFGHGEVRETKATPFLGGVYEQQNEIKSKDEASDTYDQRVIHIIKDGVQRNNKNISFFETVDRHSGKTAADRSKASVSHVYDDYISTSDKPDIPGHVGSRDAQLAQERESLRQDMLDNLRSHDVNTQQSKM